MLKIEFIQPEQKRINKLNSDERQKNSKTQLTKEKYQQSTNSPNPHHNANDETVHTSACIHSLILLAAFLVKWDKNLNLFRIPIECWMCVYILWLLPLAGFTLRGWYLLTSSLRHVQWKRCSFPSNLIPLSMRMNKCDFIWRRHIFYCLFEMNIIYRSSLKILLPMQMDLLYCRVVFFFFVFRFFFCIHFDSFTFFVKNSFNFFSFCFVSKTFSFFLVFVLNSELWTQFMKLMTRQMGFIHTESGKLVVCERATRDFN